MARSGNRRREILRCTLVFLILILWVSSSCLGGTKKVGGEDKVFTYPVFWARAESLYGDYGGACWLKEKKTKIEYEGGNWVTTEAYHHQIVVLDATKMERYADVSLPFGPSSRIVDLKARTITSDGNVFEIKKDQIFEKSLVPGFMLYSERKAKVFAMPGYCDHCILDISYTVRDEGHYLTDEFEFAKEIPVRLSRYSYAVDPIVIRAGLGVFYKCYNLFGKPREEAYETANGTIVQWTWEIENTNAYPIEDWMPPRETVIPRILVGSGEQGQKEVDWGSFADWYRELLADADVPCQEVRGLAESVILPAQSEREKIQSIADKVGTDTRYVAVVLSQGEWRPHEPKTVIQNKYGDCKDMSLLTIAMLREAGIKAYPALLRTKMEGDIDRELLVPRFDHMIIRIEGSDTTYWLDPTAAPCPLGYLPYPDRDVNALVITDDGALWTRTPGSTPFPSLKGMTTLITLSAEGNIVGNTRLRYEGDFAAFMMPDLRQRSKEDLQDEIESKVKTYLSGVTLTACDVLAMKDSPPVVTLVAQYQRPSVAVRIEDKMALKLDFLSPTTLNLAEIGATRERRYPMWFPYAWTECDTVCVDVPSGWEVDRLPMGSEYRGEYGYCRIGYSQTNNQVIFTRRYTLSAEFVGPGEFDSFIGFWREVRDKANRDIILRKI